MSPGVGEDEVSRHRSDGGNNEGTRRGVNKGVSHTLIRAGRRRDDSLTPSDALASQTTGDEVLILAVSGG